MMESATMHRIAIVTDSTSDLPAALVAQYHISVVPLTLILGDETWRDGVDITPAAFYQKLEASDDFPSTSQPNVATFQELFSTLARDYEGIVCVLLSSSLSGTVASAQAAAANLPDTPIEIVDSRCVSMMLGFPVLAASREAAAGGDLQSVTDVAREVAAKSHIYFVVDTLEYLYRGGRIGAASKFAGSLLNLKPILSIEEGVVVPVGRVRTRRKALKSVMGLVEEKIRPGGAVQMAVFDVAAPDEADRFLEQVQERFQPVELLRGECTPVLGAHVGPGTVGVAWYAE